jgi:septum formation protein
LDIILASQSPRRQELLKRIVKNFRVIPSDADETLPEGITPINAVELLAQKKAEAVAKKNPQSIVIGSDTIVVYNNEILGKPKDKEDCLRMINALSGNTHQVYTGVAIITPDETKVFYEETDVVFDKMDKEEIEWYANLKEPYDKAGGYGIQGMASLFIAGIKGDYSNVMGLPVNKIYKYIKKMKINYNIA